MPGLTEASPPPDGTTCRLELTLPDIREHVQRYLNGYILKTGEEVDVLDVHVFEDQATTLDVFVIDVKRRKK